MEEKYNLQESAEALGLPPDMVRELIKQLIDEKEDYLKGIRKALNPLDYNALSKGAHKLKGPAVNLRAHSIAQLAETMENGAKKLEKMDYESLLIALEEEFAILESQI